jgi:fatty-acyl-CoA synthase
LREHLQRSLAAHKVPRVFEFVDELPRSGTGKLARYKLRERLGGGPSPVSGD